jgi:hypothetical protein
MDEKLKIWTLDFKLKTECLTGFQEWSILTQFIELNVIF